MLPTMPDLGDLTNDQAACAIIEACGERAPALVAEQIGQHHNQPEVARHWRGIAAAITAISQAQLHMEIALDLLDTQGSLAAGAHLDAAISSLGIRHDDVVRVLTGQASPDQAARYYGERVDQHLALAARADDPAVKGLHLDIASRYATLRQLAPGALETRSEPTP